MTAVALVDLANAVGGDLDVLIAADNPERLVATLEAAGSAIAELTNDVFDRFFDQYGDAAEVVITTGDLPQLTAAGRVDPDELDRLRADAARAGSATYGVVVDLDKTALAKRLAASAEGTQVVVYFFLQAAIFALERGPSEFEREVWKRPNARLILVALDAQLSIIGECLSVLGGSHLDRVDEESFRPMPPGLARIAQRRNDYIGWDGGLTTSLTPRHFACLSAEPHNEFIRFIGAMMVALAVAYTCDRARRVERVDGTYYVRAEFRGRDHVAFVPLAYDAPIADLQPDQSRAVLEAVDWCYQPVPEHPETDMVADRLPWLQTRIAQVLETRPEEQRFAAFAQLMPQLLDGVKWNWRAFIEGRVTEYLQHVRDLERWVGEAVDRLSDQTAGLVKRLSETALAAVAALIGSFIAAAFKNPFNADLFRIGMLTYAGYVLVFPGILGISSAFGDVRLAEDSFDSQRVNLAHALDRKKMDAIIGQRVETARRRFRFWAVVVGALYISAAVAAGVAAFTVPNIIGSAPSGQAPHPITTATTSP
jgi:hypothetical protein